MFQPAIILTNNDEPKQNKTNEEQHKINDFNLIVDTSNYDNFVLNLMKLSFKPKHKYNRSNR